MIVGVTGASGFIGKKTIKILKDSGHEVRRFVRREVKNDDEIYWSPAKKEIDKDREVGNYWWDVCDCKSMVNWRDEFFKKW